MNKLLRISNSFLLSIEVVFAFFVLFLSLMVASGGTGGLVGLASILSPISIISLIVMMIQMIRARTHAIGKYFVYLVHAGTVVAITTAIYETFVPTMEGYNTEVPPRHIYFRHCASAHLSSCYDDLLQQIINDWSNIKVRLNRKSFFWK